MIFLKNFLPALHNEFPFGACLYISSILLNTLEGSLGLVLLKKLTLTRCKAMINGSSVLYTTF